jgi:uncharacterized damage-inducible protein DinB
MPTDAWLSGPIEGIDPYLLPAAHALIQAREDLPRAVDGVTPEQLWARPGGAASVGFHLRHIAGALDRLMTYARGETLTDEQKAAARAEQEAGAGVGTLLDGIEAAVERALAQIRATPRDAILAPRPVDRAALPSTVLGLIFHAAEHTTRHTGQVITTMKIVSDPGRG